MKKLTFLIYHKEYDKFLESLQKLGVVHIQRSNDQSAADKYMSSILSKQEELKHLDKVIADLQNVLEIETLPEPGDAGGAVMYVIQADSIEDSIHANEQDFKRYQESYETLKPWGYFDRSLLTKLENKGIVISYYKADKKFLKHHPEYSEGLVGEDKSNVYFVVFSQKGTVLDVPATPVELPSESLAQCEQYLDRISEQTVSLHEQQKKLAQVHLADIIAYRSFVKNEIVTLQAREDTVFVADNKIMVVEGWYPADLNDKVEAYLKSVNTYYEVRDPQQGDNVPTLLKNGPVTRLFERLTKMYGFPDYDEWDPTPVVAPFFTLFFAICMGDGGYGVLIALYGLLDLAGKSKKVPILGEMLAGCGGMILTLGIATTVVGFMLGTVFGINIVEAGWIPADTTLGSVMAWLQGNVPGTKYSIQMAGAIAIGVFHICLAMIIKALLFTKKEGLKNHLGTWGWVILLVGGVITGILAMAGALTEQATELVLICIGAVSALGIFLLNNMARLASKPVLGIILNPLAGLYDTYNMASGLLGDILSYIRLYALCLAGGMLGGAFNMIGDMVGADGGAMIIPAVIIYVIGHIFNLLMSAISAFVHPLRLNFVEYFKNAGFDGKGTGYNPYKVQK
ncbi:MAG: hypothetical protein K6E54_03755 [Bacteroidaceae bacterium]|nr:hypothetical protein [Bacteroidaceae bacterium]